MMIKTRRWLTQKPFGVQVSSSLFVILLFSLNMTSTNSKNVTTTITTTTTSSANTWNKQKQKQQTKYWWNNNDNDEEIIRYVNVNGKVKSIPPIETVEEAQRIKLFEDKYLMDCQKPIDDDDEDGDYETRLCTSEIAIQTYRIVTFLISAPDNDDDNGSNNASSFYCVPK